MRKLKFTDNQIMVAVKRVEAGFAVPDIAGAGYGNVLKRQAEFGGMNMLIMARMKELGDENRRLKKTYLAEMRKAEIVVEELEKKL